MASSSPRSMRSRRDSHPYTGAPPASTPSPFLRKRRMPRLPRADLPTPSHDVLVRGELLHADGPARMEPVGGNADLCPHAEFAAVRELRGGVVQHDGAIYRVEEFLRGGGVRRDDAVGVRRA